MIENPDHLLDLLGGDAPAMGASRPMVAARRRLTITRGKY